MDTIEKHKMNLKKRRNLTIGSKPTKDETKNYVNFLITRVLLAVIIFFAAVILMNTTEFGHNFIKDTVLTENMSFSHFADLYNTYLGNVIPFEDLVKDDQTVFSEKLSYDSLENYKDGYALTVKKNYLTPTINAGIVVFIGEKEGYGNTVIIQGIDEVDYWYSNVTNLSVSLYDYVSKGSYLGTADGDKLYLVFKKGSDYLEFDEVVN